MTKVTDVCYIGNMEQLQTILAGNNTILTIAVLAFIALDVITGISKGASQGEISSQKMKSGFWHKSAFIFALALALLIDWVTQLGANIGVNGPIFKSACAYLYAMELVSIIENIVEINPEFKGAKVLRLFGHKEPEEVEGKTE